jgi:S-adenosylmethionine decarboxylase
MKLLSPEDSSVAPSCDQYGKHLLLTLRGCDRDLLDDEQFLRNLVERAARESGATILTVVSHKFVPVGVTVVALLAESHASLHTYPESGYLFWDCFTCGLHCLPQGSVPILVEALRPLEVSEVLLQRK